MAIGGADQGRIDGVAFGDAAQPALEAEAAILVGEESPAALRLRRQSIEALGNRLRDARDRRPIAD